MKKSLFAASAALAIVGAASADFVVNFAGPFVFGPLAGTTVATTPLIGTLTGVTISFNFYDSTGGSWVSDVAATVDSIQWSGEPNLVNGAFARVGGWVGLPNNSVNGFYNGSSAVASNVVYDGTMGAIVGIGNSYTGGGFTADSVTVTLIGVDKIPAPGALALLGLAGVVGRRRRA